MRNNIMDLNKIEEELLNRWILEWNEKPKFNNKKIILIDKLNFISYLILCKNEKFKILRKSKKYKKVINQLKNLFPEHNLNVSSNNFTFVRLLDEPLNEIVVGVKNNQVIGGGSGIYEI